MNTGCAPSRRRLLSMLAAAPLLSACAGEPRAPAFRSPRPEGDARVALLVPLTGARAALGKQMAKAVWLVEDLGGTPGRTQVLDAGETPQSAADAALRAVAQGSTIIVGPLFRDQTPAVVQAAGDVPVMSLSNDVTLTASGAWVFGVTPTQSVETVLGFAKSTGARRVTVLDTPGALGQRAISALNTQARNARVTALPVIPSGTAPADMSVALRQSGGGTMPDIVYVPSTSATALKQAVAAVGTGLTTIGSLQWSGLPQTELDRLDKACFTGPDPVRFNRLSAVFRAQLEEEMGVIAALGVDGVGMAQTLGGSRPLNRRTPYEGLLGKTRFDAGRTAQRDLAILRIDGGNVLPVT